MEEILCHDWLPNAQDGDVLTAMNSSLQVHPVSVDVSSKHKNHVINPNVLCYGMLLTLSFSAC